MPEASLRITFDMPLPPASGRLVAWIDEARAAIHQQQQQQRRMVEPTAIIGYARLKVRAGLVEPLHPLTLAVGPIVEVLAALGVVQGAESVTDTETRWDITVVPGRVAVEVSRTRSPRARPSAAARQRHSLRLRALHGERAAKAARAAG